jgi:hypothetical protein
MSISNENCLELYLDLMKRSLLNTIYSEYEYCDFRPRNKAQRFLFQQLLMPQLKKRNAKVITPYNYDENQRKLGMDWPPTAHSMIGLERMNNIQHCVIEVIKNNVPGDLIETGVWRGGATIFMRAILKAYGITDRKVWVCDSFEGLPKPDEAKYPQDKGDKHHKSKELAISLEQVKNNFKKYGLLDNQVIFLKGWFKDTLPTAPIEQIAVARLDGDMYESTIEALDNLYHKILIGGFLIIDDYGAVKGCKEAVHDFRKKHAIKEEIITIDWGGIYWQKLF